MLKLKKQRLKEKIEADVGALVQFLLDERDSLLESLDAEEVATMAVIDDNLKTVETEAEAVDKAIADIHSHISGKTSFEVSMTCQPLDHRGGLTYKDTALNSLCLSENTPPDINTHCLSDHVGMTALIHCEINIKRV